ncbi:MAG: SWIM zinc finger family protein [Zavarzinella sp.]|nr:SWIM zinc finger family protein [Zavarzinella sp.]
MDLRELKALELAARAKIVFHLGRWLVPSQTTGKAYPLTLDPPTCQCEDFQLRQQPCKHVIAARLVAERDGGESAPPFDTDVEPKRPTYRQNWPAYTLAQTTEKHRFRELLHDLARSAPNRPAGRARDGPRSPSPTPSSP